MARGRSRVSHSDGGEIAAVQSATTGYEAELWAMADALRGAMDAAEYKHVVLGLIFLKYISDAFEERHAALVAEQDQGADPEDPTSTAPRTSSGCRPRPAGATSRPKRGSPPSASSSTVRWPASSATTRRSRTCCPRITPAQPSTSGGSAGSSTWSATSWWATRTPAPRTCSAAFTSISCRSSRAREGKKGGEFYTPPLRRQAAGRDAGALSRPGLRPLLRLVRHVRAIGRIHRRSRDRQRQQRQGARRHLDLGPGVEPYDLADRADEPRHPRHRGADRSRRQLPQRSPP